MCDLVEMVIASVGGAAYVNQIVAAVQNLEGVDSVTVSLMSNSAD